MEYAFDFPPQFRLQNICDITGRVFRLKENPHKDAARRTVLDWFSQYPIYNSKKNRKFLAAEFDVFAALSFPDADEWHLTTSIMFFFWAFSTDDLSDEGEMQKRPDDVENGHKLQRAVINNLDGEKPSYPYAAMFYDLLRRMKQTTTPGVMSRFIQGYLDHSASQVEQSQLRSVDHFYSVEEFIIMRRATIGGLLIRAMTEYVAGINLPEYVFEDPTMIALSEATDDILTWPNDICSFNKEQADGDYQNLVCILMVEHKIDLQTAVDMLTDMIAQRVKDYETLKAQLPSWGPEVDPEVSRYIEASEYMVQGCVVWYYSSKRYFRNIDPRGKDYIIWDVYPSTTSPPPERTEIESGTISLPEPVPSLFHFGRKAGFSVVPLVEVSQNHPNLSNFGKKLSSSLENFINSHPIVSIAVLGSSFYVLSTVFRVVFSV